MPVCIRGGAYQITCDRAFVRRPCSRSTFLLYKVKASLRSTGRAKNSNPPGKIWYLWNCSKLFCQIYNAPRGGFRPHILHILLQCLVAFKNYNYLNVKYSFQSEQVIKLRFWLSLEETNGHRIRQISIHWTILWGHDAGRYRKYTPKPTNFAELKSTCHFEKVFDRVLMQLADTLNTQFKYREGSGHSLLKRLKC